MRECAKVCLSIDIVDEVKILRIDEFDNLLVFDVDALDRNFELIVFGEYIYVM